MARRLPSGRAAFSLQAFELPQSISLASRTYPKCFPLEAHSLAGSSGPAALSSGFQQSGRECRLPPGQYTHKPGLPSTCSWRTGTQTPFLDSL